MPASAMAWTGRLWPAPGSGKRVGVTVKVDTEGPVGTVTLARPKANAFDDQQVTRLDEAMQEVDAAEHVRAVVLRAEGEVAFSAGADLGGVGPMAEPEAFGDWTRRAHAMLDRIESFRVPVVAAIRRPAAGGGLELALACQLRVLGRDAHLSLPEMRRGYLPSWCALERLTRLTGIAFATDMLLTARRVGADEALARGLVHRVADDTEAEALKLAQTLASMPPLAVRAALGQLAGIARGDDRPTTRRREIADLERLVRTEDTVEGIMAFFEKRTPSFKGR